MLFSSICLAQSISYQQAEQNALRDSYTTQAHQALQQASQLEAEALKGLGLPRVDFNVRAYAFHNELDVPLGALKNNLEQTLSNGVSSKIDEWQGTLGSAADPLKDGLNQTIHDGVGLIPDSSQVVLKDQVI
ncbi:MAG: TolC family protein, partial [Acinetobacter sp.]|nr:TolC family protein [Acinetobacter sp.]